MVDAREVIARFDKLSTSPAAPVVLRLLHRRLAAHPLVKSCTEFWNRGNRLTGRQLDALTNMASARGLIIPEFGACPSWQHDGRK